MLKTTLAAVFAAVCGASAQAGPISDSQFGFELGQVFAQSVSSGRALGKAMAQRKAQDAPVGVLGQVLTAMRDAPGTGEKIAQWLQDNRAVVEFSDMVMKGNSAHAWLVDFVPEPRKPAVYITPLLLRPPVSYRLLGALIAKEGTELMLKDFPESAERRTMVASAMAETYFELGGTRAALPNFDGTIDEESAAAIRVWVENAPDSGVQYYRDRGYKTLGEVREGLLSEQSQAADEGRSQKISRLIEAADKAQATFEGFRQAEADWIMTHRPS